MSNFSSPAPAVTTISQNPAPSHPDTPAVTAPDLDSLRAAPTALSSATDTLAPAFLAADSVSAAINSADTIVQTLQTLTTAADELTARLQRFNADFARYFKGNEEYSAEQLQSALHTLAALMAPVTPDLSTQQSASDSAWQGWNSPSTLTTDSASSLGNPDINTSTGYGDNSFPGAYDSTVDSSDSYPAPELRLAAVRTLEALIAGIDHRLSTQINQVIHHEDFTRIEGAWRGLRYLVTHTPRSEHIKIRVLSVSKKELGKTIRRFKGVFWDQSPLFRKIYENEYGTAGGEPFGILIGDYTFSHSAPDLEILRGMAQIAAAAHAPFISAADPVMMNLESWQSLSNPRDLSRLFQTPEYAGWRALRNSDDSRYLVLTLPRILARVPFGVSSCPVKGFAFEEDLQDGDKSCHVWMSSAFALALVIARSFDQYGWCARIRGFDSGGLVSDFPAALTSDPDSHNRTAQQCLLETAITDRQEAELSANGFLPLCYWKNTQYAVFTGSQSVNRPPHYQDAQAEANAVLSARLPYILAVTRFAHYLKCIVRDKIGSFKDRAYMEEWLTDWFSQFVTSDPDASEEIKAKYPLAEARIEISPIESQPSYYQARLYLRPHYQLEGLTTSLRLNTKIPGGDTR